MSPVTQTCLPDLTLVWPWASDIASLSLKLFNYKKSNSHFPTFLTPEQGNKTPKDPLKQGLVPSENLMLDLRWS